MPMTKHPFREIMAVFPKGVGKTSVKEASGSRWVMTTPLPLQERRQRWRLCHFWVLGDPVWRRVVLLNLRREAGSMGEP